MKKVRIWPVLLAAAIGFCILCGLGVWQVKRLAWKEALIAEIDARMRAEPVSLLEAMKAPAENEYLRIRTTGFYWPEQSLRRIATYEGGPGYELLHPFVSNDGVVVVLVDRGTIAIDDNSVEAPSMFQSVTIDGLLRLHNKGRGAFDGDNDEKGNLWVWWDIPAMLDAAHVHKKARRAPFILQLLPSSALLSKPFVAAPKIELSNNHLGYAITWFGLAAALVGVTGAFIWRSTRS